MKKTLISLLCCLSMAFGFSAPTISALAESMPTETICDTMSNSSVLDDMGENDEVAMEIELSATFEKYSYSTNELIPITFSLASSIELNYTQVEQNIEYETKSPVRKDISPSKREQGRCLVG